MTEQDKNLKDDLITDEILGNSEDAGEQVTESVEDTTDTVDTVIEDVQDVAEDAETVEDVVDVEDTTEDVASVESVESVESVKELNADTLINAVETKALAPKTTLIQQMSELNTKYVALDIKYQEVVSNLSEMSKMLQDEQALTTDLTKQVTDLKLDNEALAKSNVKLKDTLALKPYTNVSEGTEPLGATTESKTKAEIYESLNGNERYSYFSKHKEEILDQLRNK